MVLENLGSKLKDSLRRLIKASYIDKELVEELTEDIKKALISSDVNVKLADSLCEKIKRRAIAEKPAKTLTAREHTVNIIYEELTRFLGGEKEEIKIENKPTVILLEGLFGSGKTTTAGKLAKFYKKRGHKVATVQTDTFRPAAYDQLKQLSKEADVKFYGEEKEKDPVKVLKKYSPEFKKYDVIIVDSAGRDALNSELIKEIKSINDALKPDEKLLVISADIGQAAQKQAQAFYDTTGITGIIVTKLDGTAKGGGALAACSISGGKVKFIAVGEKINDIEQFKPKNFVSRLLGMGDLETLLEKAKEAISTEDAEEAGKRLMDGKFNLNDLYTQLETMNKVGPLKQITQMIPGMGAMNLPKEALQKQEGQMKVWKYVMDSMTPDEKEDPSILDGSRVERIAEGSGRSVQEVRSLIKQYTQMKKAMKMLGSPKKMQKFMKMFGQGKLPMNF